MALFSAACYGVAMPLARMAYDHGTNALTIMTLRYLSLALILAAWLLIGGRSLKVPARTLAVCLVIGVTFVGTAGGALASIVYMPVSLAVLVFYTYPTLTLLAECVLERRAPHRIEIAAVLLALLGLALTLQASLGAFHLIGVELALVASVSAAVALILTSRTLKKIGARLIGLYACAVASGISAAIMLSWERFSLPHTGIGILLLTLVIAAFNLAVLTMFASLKSVGASRAATIFCIEPVVGVLTAIVLLGEHLVLQQWLGAGLVGVAILIASRLQPEAKEL